MSSTSSLFTAFGLAAALSSVACSADEGTTSPQPLVEVAELSSWPEVRDCRFSVEHDAQHIVVQTDPSAEKSYLSAQYPFAEGTLLIKALYDDAGCTELSGYAVMRRRAHADTSQGGWEWQQLDAAGVVVGPENPQRCVSCHQSCSNDRDLACTDP